jgi:hypothetical protein
MKSSRYPFQDFRQEIVLRTRPGALAHVLRSLKILDGILVPLVDEKSRYPFQNFRQDIVLLSSIAQHYDCPSSHCAPCRVTSSHLRERLHRLESSSIRFSPRQIHAQNHQNALRKSFHLLKERKSGRILSTAPWQTFKLHIDEYTELLDVLQNDEGEENGNQLSQRGGWKQVRPQKV